MSPAMWRGVKLRTSKGIAMKSDDQRLMWHGMFLFLLGLVTGLLERRFTNMRMGVSAHLEGGDERHLFGCCGGDLERGPPFTAGQDGSILNRPLRDLRELGVHH